MKKYLILGDTLAILVVTLIGFATHGGTDIAFLPRMAAVFLPLLIAWFMLSPFLGLFQRTCLAFNSENEKRVKGLKNTG